ncbi:MAG: TIGR02281 family clan AA aspartic protease [Roseibium sp.]
MWRFVLILLILVGLAPLVPDFLEEYLGKSGKVAFNVSRADKLPNGGRHRISVNRHGQYVTDVELNGRLVEMLVDTGASRIALPVSVAEEIGIFLKRKDFTFRIGTANGDTLGARVMIDRMEIGSIYLKNIDAMVLQDESLSTPLLGMSALNKLDRFDFSDGTLVLVQ